MTIEQKDKIQPLRQALPLTVPNVISAILDSPLHMRVSTGILTEDGKTVATKHGAVQVDRADARPGQKVVVYEI